MRRQRFLTPAKATLTMLGVATVALMGVPGFGHYDPPDGPLTGSVTDARGLGLGDVEVALFDDRELSLVATTRTDPQGSFAFHQVPPGFDVYARAVHGERLVGAWDLGRVRTPFNRVELRLSAGRPVTFRVVGADGAPVAEAEVRAYDARSRVVALDRVLTDADGRASVVAPARAHFAVLGRDRAAPSWVLDQEIPENGREFTVTLAPAVTIEGRVVDEAGSPVAGILVSGWEFADGERWTGYALSDEDGRFALSGRSDDAILRVCDPAQRYLPAVLAGTEAEGELVLRPGLPLEVRTRCEDEAVPAVLWIWAEDAGAWGWGAATDATGLLRTRVSAVHGIVAEPLDPAFARTEAWALTLQGPSRLLAMRRSVAP